MGIKKKINKIFHNVEKKKYCSFYKSECVEKECMLYSKRNEICMKKI